MIENEIEHTYIVPRQIAAELNDPPQLELDARRIWETYPWATNAEPWRSRYANLMGWLAADYLSAELQRHIADCLRKESIYGEAVRFGEKMSALKGQKHRQAACALRFLRLDSRDYALWVVDVRGRTEKQISMPLH